MSTPVQRDPIRFEVQVAPPAPQESAASQPRRIAPAPQPRNTAPPRDALDPPPENQDPRRRRGEGCGICSLICRCIADFFRAIFRYFCPPSAPQREAPRLNREQQVVDRFLNQFPRYLDDESSADRREEFWTAFKRLPPAAQLEARKEVYAQQRRLIDAEVERAASRSASRLETKKPHRAFQQDPLSDAINDGIDNFIRNNHYNVAVREALNRFIGREEESRGEE
jgi:hypothetical protein